MSNVLKMDIDKQCRSRLDAAIIGVWSLSTLFAEAFILFTINAEIYQANTKKTTFWKMSKAQ